MRFSLAIAIALLLGSYVAGVPVRSSPEEGEISDGEGSPGHNGNTPEGSHRSGGSGVSSDPSIGLGLNRDNRGTVGTAQLGYYATPERYAQNPDSNHWAIDHPVIAHGQQGSNVAITSMTSTRQGGQPAENFGFSNQKAGSRLETAGGPRFIPQSAFHPTGTGPGDLQQTDKGYRDLARVNRQEVQGRTNPPQIPHNPSYQPNVLPPMHWGGPSTQPQPHPGYPGGPPAQPHPGYGGLPPPPNTLPQRPPPPLRQSTLPAGGYHPHAPLRQSTLPAPGPHGLPLNPYSQMPPQMHNPQGGLPPPPAHLPLPPHMQGGLPPPPAHLPLPPHMQGGLPPPPAHLPAPPHMQGGLPPPPPGAGLPPRPPSRGGSVRYGSSRYNPYPPRGPGGAGGAGTGV